MSEGGRGGRLSGGGGAGEDALEGRLRSALASSAEQPVDVHRLVRGARAGARAQHRRQRTAAVLAGAAALAVVAVGSGGLLGVDLVERLRGGPPGASSSAGPAAEGSPAAPTGDSAAVLQPGDLGPAHEGADRVVEVGATTTAVPLGACPDAQEVGGPGVLLLRSDAEEERVVELAVRASAGDASVPQEVLTCAALEVVGDPSTGGTGTELLARTAEGVEPQGAAAVHASGGAVVLVAVERGDGEAAARASALLDVAVERAREAGLLE